MTTTPTLDSAMEHLVRRVVKEVVSAELSMPAMPAAQTPDLFSLAKVSKKTGVSLTALKRLRKEGSLVPDAGEGRLARFSVAGVKAALDQHARATAAPRAKALALLGRRR